MALQRIPGVNNHLLASIAALFYTGSQLASRTLDAAADRITMIGRFVHEDGTTKTVDGVEFLFGAVSKTLLSTMQVSLQNVSLSTGPVMQEDGTPDQTLTIANADAGFVTNAWYGGDFDGAATRSLAIGELVAVVFQFGTFFAGDTVAIRGISISGSVFSDNQAHMVTNLSGAYGDDVLLSNVIFRCSDGSFGTLHNAWPCSAYNEHAVNVDSGTADEYALGIQFPFSCGTDGLAVYAAHSGASNTTEHLLYSGTTALQTIVIDHNAILATSSIAILSPYPEQVLSANTLGRVSIRPTGTTNISIYSTDVNEVGHMSCLPGGAAFHLWTRLDQGAWGGEVTTRRLLAGVRLSAFDDGAGSGGKARIIGG